AAFTAAEQGARFLVLAGRPLNEPIVQYGPFVMNTMAEIEQAVRDYQTGRLTA
ncbi:MAG: pirin-like C-terminal cupin domain-containing protein, partial [Burkholderiaceae bacterium]